MDVWQALIMGLVQGITEFIPVSSSGHLVLVPYLLNIKAPSVTFDVCLHFGTLLALLPIYWQDVGKILMAFISGLRDAVSGNFSSKFKEDPYKRLAFMIIISSIPTAIIGLLFKDFFEGLFENVPGVSFSLLITGVLLWLAKNKDGEKEILEMSIISALIIGIAQGCAIAPGISRSGATIVGGLLFCDLSKRFAAKYAFLLFMPAIFGASLIKFKDVGTASEGSLLIVLGSLTAAISGYLAVRSFLWLIQRIRLSWFAYYCWIAGLSCLILYYFLSYNLP